MLNQVVLVGRLTKDAEVKEVEEGKKVAHITLAVQRSIKNVDGEYDTDFIGCTVWNGIANSVSEYCHKGDIIGVKGRLQMTMIEDKYGVEVVAEKVTFLSSRKPEEE